MMFKSFFPKPWAVFHVGVCLGAADRRRVFGRREEGDWVARLVASDEVPISAARFWSLDHSIFYAYYLDLRGIICNVLVHP